MRAVACVALGAATLGLPGAMAADTLPAPSGTTAGDAERGRAIAADRRLGLCTLCHTAPLPEPHLQGNLGPPLVGVGARLSAEQLRLRLVDPKQLNPDSVMPAYGAASGFTRVQPRHAGQALLSPQQIEDVVAWLQTLR
jgi:sulfur-oxidizing protein SoxX